MTDLYLKSAASLFTALIISFAATPFVKWFAVKIGAVDVPKDARRMHKVIMPLCGGLAIFAGFFISVIAFGIIDNQMRAILIGAVLITVLGVLDDVLDLKAYIKLLWQVVAALIPVLLGVRIEALTYPFAASGVIELGAFSIPFTVLWIVGITNAVNLIDGLDGLAVGVSSIASITMFVISIMTSYTYTTLTLAALAGACLGFMPYNLNPAKIFMGDTGALFLGYMLATVSVQGLFKSYALISFVVPLLVLSLPILDTAFAILRRVLKGKRPFEADRGHVHHKLIDMGFDQKQSVAILYTFSSVLGFLAVVLATSQESRVLILALAVLITLFLGININTKRLPRDKEGQSQAPGPGGGDDEEK